MSITIDVGALTGLVQEHSTDLGANWDGRGSLRLRVVLRVLMDSSVSVFCSLTKRKRVSTDSHSSMARMFTWPMRCSRV